MLHHRHRSARPCAGAEPHGHCSSSRSVVRLRGRRQRRSAAAAAAGGGGGGGGGGGVGGELLLGELASQLGRPPTVSSSSSSSTGGGPRVAVVGAGVVGLTTALRVLERLGPTAQVTVFAAAFGNDLTSAGAAGVWMPYKLSETPEVLTARWGAETFRHLRHLVHSPDAARAGTMSSLCHSLFLASEPEPFWSSTVTGFRRMGGEELALFGGAVDWPGVQAAAAAAAAAAQGEDGGGSGGGAGDGSIDSLAAAAAATGFVEGHTFNTIVCEGRLYLRYLTDRLLALGARIVQRRFSCLAELAALPATAAAGGGGLGQQGGFDVVVNCAGLGAATLLPDPAAFPIRGQVVRVRAPWVSQCVFAHFADETAYVIPNSGSVVLGGTGQVGSWDTTTSLRDVRGIAARAMQVVPSLRDAAVLETWAGLRPGRVRLRLEAEALDAATLEARAEAAGVRVEGRLRAPLKVVHNFGHGGSGLTLAWGTAGDAADLVAQQLS